MGAVAQLVFGVFVFLQINLTVWIVPAFVAGAIAGERGRGPLGDLLITRLSNAEIVLGKLAAGPVQYATCMAPPFPLPSLLPLLRGGGATLGLVAYAST